MSSQYYSGNLPEWFKEKHEDSHLFPDGLMVVSRSECKIRSNEFFEDYHKAITESGMWQKHEIITVEVVVLAEDGFVSKVILAKNEIKYFWLLEVQESDNVWMDGQNI